MHNSGFKFKSEKIFCWDTILLSLVILASLGVVIYVNYPAFVNDYIWTDDDRANTFWFHKLIDKELLRDDLLTEYTIFYESLGTKYFYTLASYVINPFLLVKIIPLIFLPLVSIVLYKMGRTVSGPFCGFLAAAFFIGYPTHLSHEFNCGYSRAFSYPGLLLFLYFLLARKTGHLIWLVPLVSLFYPMAFMICAVTWFFWIVIQMRWAPINIDRKKLAIHFLASMLLSGLFIIPKYAFPDDRFGRLLTFEETINNPGAYEGGRNTILPHKPVYEKVIQFLDQPFIVFSFLIILFFLRWEALKIPLELWLFIFSGLLLYQLAYYFLLHLYFPEKYFFYTFPMAVFFILSLGLGRIVEKIQNVSGKVISLCVITVIFYIFYGQGIKPSLGKDDFSGNKPLYEHLKTLPKNSLIAAPPHLADDIPLLAARKVLFNFELASPWFTTYYETIKERTEGFFEAYYANDLADLMEFTEKFGIDYIIVDQRLYKHLDRERFYIDPYNDFIKKLVQKKQFYLRDHLTQLAQFRFGPYYVIDAQRLELPLSILKEENLHPGAL